MSAWTCPSDGKAAQKIVRPRPRIPHDGRARLSLSIESSLKLISDAQAESQFEARKCLAGSKGEQIVGEVRVYVCVPQAVVHTPHPLLGKGDAAIS